MTDVLSSTAVLVLAVVLGVTGVTDPVAAAGIVVGPLLAMAVFVSATFRLLVVVAGALIVFQAPSDRIKYVYLGLTLICVAVSFIELLRDDDEVRRAFRPMMAGSLVVLALMAVSYFNARAYGNNTGDWFRDMLSYLLCAMLPLVGLDAARRITPRAMAVVFGVVGVASALGFAADWLNRRGAVEGLGRVILATATLPLLMLAYAVVRASGGSARVRWTAIAVVIPAALVITGTRTYLIEFVAILAGVVGSAGRGRVVPSRMLGFLGVGGGLTAVLVYLLARDWITDSGFVQGRVAATVAAVTGHATTDQSYLIRANSYRLAEQAWREHPWWGAGPGHLYSTGSFSLDTPLQVPAKFGIVGTVVMIGFMISVVVSIRRCQRSPDPFYTAGRGWAFALVALIPFGSWFEDKGTSLAIALIVCATASVAHARRATIEEVVEAEPASALDRAQATHRRP